MSAEEPLATSGSFVVGSPRTSASRCRAKRTSPTTASPPRSSDNRTDVGSPRGNRLRSGGRGASLAGVECRRAVPSLGAALRDAGYDQGRGSVAQRDCVAGPYPFRYRRISSEPRAAPQVLYQGGGPEGSIPAARSSSAGMYTQQPRSRPFRCARRRAAESYRPARSTSAGASRLLSDTGDSSSSVRPPAPGVRGRGGICHCSSSGGW